MPKLKVSLGIGYPGANQSDVIEIDDGEWSECKTDAARESLIDSYAIEWAWNYIDISASIEEN